MLHHLGPRQFWLFRCSGVKRWDGSRPIRSLIHRDKPTSLPLPDTISGSVSTPSSPRVCQGISLVPSRHFLARILRNRRSSWKFTILGCLCAYRTIPMRQNSRHRHIPRSGSIPGRSVVGAAISACACVRVSTGPHRDSRARWVGRIESTVGGKPLESLHHTLRDAPVSLPLRRNRRRLHATTATIERRGFHSGYVSLFTICGTKVRVRHVLRSGRSPLAVCGPI